MIARTLATNLRADDKNEQLAAIIMQKCSNRLHYHITLNVSERVEILGDSDCAYQHLNKLGLVISIVLIFLPTCNLSLYVNKINAN
jgi:hypothetical protein